MYRTTSSTLRIDVPTNLRSIFMKRCDFEKPQVNNKVTVIGLSSVSISIILTLFNDQTFGRIVCFDLDSVKVHKELSELIVKAPTRFFCGSDYALTADTDVFVIALATGDIDITKPPENLASPINDLLKIIIPKVAALSPNAIYINTNCPNNVTTHIIYKLTKAPQNKVFGIGTFPETIKLQYHLGEILNLSPTSILVQTIGSKNCVIPLWDSISAGGILIRDILGDETACDVIINSIRERREKIATSSNYLDWTKAFSIWLILISILVNRTAIIPLSCNAQDVFDIKEETFLSLPCCVSRNGIAYVIKPNISERSKEKIFKTVAIQLIAQKALGY